MEKFKQNTYLRRQLIDTNWPIKTKTIRFIRRRCIPKGEKAVYTRLVVDLRPNKEVHERLRMCVGGDQMTCVMDTTTRTADLTTCKLHVNSVISTPNAKFGAADVKDFYLNTPLKKKRYGKVQAKYIPQETIDRHQLADQNKNNSVH